MRGLVSALFNLGLFAPDNGELLGFCLPDSWETYFGHAHVKLSKNQTNYYIVCYWKLKSGKILCLKLFL